MKYILSIDQSTQGTKGLIFDENGRPVAKDDIPHKQIVNAKGWVEHDTEEILKNVLSVCKSVTEKSGIEKDDIIAIGISNQRETVAAWDKVTGKRLYNAIVWQCARAKELCDNLEQYSGTVKDKTGLNLSPYFSAAKFGWIMQNVPKAKEAAKENRLCFGTIDSFLIYHLTKEHSFKTDYSNASRTQLFNINSLSWDKELCGIFGVPENALPEVCMSDSVFGYTDLGGWLNKPIPIRCVLGDSQAALLGQSCFSAGQVKVTYGTGSSVMMQLGDHITKSGNGLVTSIAWGLNNKVQYVLEGNLNYTGAVISWLKNDLKLIQSANETEELAYSANPDDKCCLVPAFTGLGAPYWKSDASAIITGITRTTGKAELVKAALKSIGFQIDDLLRLMVIDSGYNISELFVDGGAVSNRYLMQFQSDISDCEICVPEFSELSGTGAAYAAGFSSGLYNMAIYNNIHYTRYTPKYSDKQRNTEIEKWKSAIKRAIL